MARSTGPITSSKDSAPRATTTLRALRITVILSVLNLAWQFVTAGQLFPRGGPEELHSTGAIVLHVLTGLTTIAAVLHWRATDGPRWPMTLAAAVFVVSFVQAYYGGHSTLAIHIPGALVLTLGAAWLAGWSFTRAQGQPPAPNTTDAVNHDV